MTRAYYYLYLETGKDTGNMLVQLRLRGEGTDGLQAEVMLSGLPNLQM